ncbi:MAG: hypothetical protein Q8L47_00540 [bacterium]|nr:hypothetical protein [bacterium]
MWKKSPDNKPLEVRIQKFEDINNRITPEVLKEMMNGYDDDVFWHQESLGNSVENDITFGTKIWTAFNEIIEVAKIKDSPEWELQQLVVEFAFLSQLTMRVDLPIDLKLRVAAILKIKEDFIEAGFKEETLRGSNLMKLAYIGEAEAMERLGMDWNESPPFTAGLQLDHDSPEVQKILEEKKATQGISPAEHAIKSDPDLEKIFDEFYRGKKPSTQ